MTLHREDQKLVEEARQVVERLRAPAQGGNTRPLRTEAADTLTALAQALEDTQRERDEVATSAAADRFLVHRFNEEFDRATAAETARDAALEREGQLRDIANRVIDEAVVHWHDAPYNTPEIAEWLGVTEQEYSDWVSKRGLFALSNSTEKPEPREEPRP